MTHNEQHQFVTELTTNICAEVKAAILADKIPADWDGHELRVLLADKFEQSAQMSLIRRDKRSERARDYHNTVITANL